MSEKYGGSFPPQKLPGKKKTKEWGQACVDYIISGMVRQGRSDMVTDYNLYNSVFDPEDFHKITNPFGVKDGSPANLQDYNIIRDKIDYLIGEECSRPFAFRVIRSNEEGASKALEEKKRLAMAFVTSQVEDAPGTTPPEDTVPLEDIDSWVAKSYKDIVESTAYHTLGYLAEKLDLTETFLAGWKDALIAGREIYYVGVIGGEPYVERVNPLEFDWGRSADQRYIEEAPWCVRHQRLPLASLYDRYYDLLEKDDLQEMEDRLGAGGDFLPQIGPSGDTGGGIRWLRFPRSSEDSWRDEGIDVYHCCWKTYKKIYYVTKIDPSTLTPQCDIVSEDYRPTGTELSVEEDWVVEVWEGYRAGEDLYFGIGPLQYQHISMTSPNSRYLPYSGVIYSNDNSRAISLVSVLKPLQYMYIVLWYRLEVALARDKGRVITMDVTQIPKSMGITPERWMHYLSSVGVNFINPYEEGVPGREGGRAASFNQVTSMDLTQGQAIQEYIALMERIETMAGRLCGVSLLRQGQVEPYTLVGTAQRAISQGAKVTLPLFHQHGVSKRHVLSMLLNAARGAWKASGKDYLQYVLDDGERQTIRLEDNFFYEDVDVFVSEGLRDAERTDQLRSLIQPAMQNGATLLEAAEVLTTDNLALLKQRLRTIEQRARRKEREDQEAQAKESELLREQQRQSLQAQSQIHEEEMDMKKYEIDQNNRTKVAVAEISSYRWSEDQDINNNGVLDVKELSRDALSRLKLSQDAFDKQRDRKVKERELLLKEKMQKEKLSHDEKMLKMKNDHASEIAKIQNDKRNSSVKSE